MAAKNINFSLLYHLSILAIFDYNNGMEIIQNCTNSLPRIKPTKLYCNDGNSICYPMTLSNADEPNRTHKPSRRFSIVASSKLETCDFGGAESQSYKLEFANKTANNGWAAFLDDYIPMFMGLVEDVNKWPGCGTLYSSSPTRYKITTTGATEVRTNASTNPTTTKPMPPYIVKSFQIRFKNFTLPITMNFTRSATCSATTTLLILTMSRRTGFVMRDAIRRTWMNDALPGQSQRFLIADTRLGEAPKVQSQLESEQAEHGDLVFLHGFEDIYHHIHLKWYAGLLWQQEYCRHTEWVMKADDDSVVYLARLDYWIEHKFRQIVAKHPLVYIGYVYINPKPIRDKDSKWYISEEVYPLSWYPDFMQGTVYLTTSATISAILSHSRECVGFYLDDVVFTGLMAELAHVARSNHRNHFIWGTEYDEWYDNREGHCEDGVPTALSMWGAETLKDFERLIGKLKSARCIQI